MLVVGNQLQSHLSIPVTYYTAEIDRTEQEKGASPISTIKHTVTELISDEL